MFRFIFTKAKCGSDLLNLGAGFCTKVEPKIRRTDINNVKLIGTIISDSYVLESGTKSLTVRTREANGKYENHQVLMNTQANFLPGQRVVINGMLNSREVVVDGDKKLKQAKVRAHQLYVLSEDGKEDVSSSSSSDSDDEKKSASGSVLPDRNYVEMLANIASDIIHKEKFATFQLATNYASKKNDTINFTHFHQVKVFDESLLEFIKNNFKKSDRVFIDGRIEHSTKTGQDGKKIFSGYIVAKNVYKVRRQSNENKVLESNE